MLKLSAIKSQFNNWSVIILCSVFFLAITSCTMWDIAHEAENLQAKMEYLKRQNQHELDIMDKENEVTLYNQKLLERLIEKGVSTFAARCTVYGPAIKTDANINRCIIESHSFNRIIDYEQNDHLPKLD